MNGFLVRFVLLGVLTSIVFAVLLATVRGRAFVQRLNRSFGGGRRSPPVVHRCARCAGTLTDVGLLSWNGGAAGDLNLLQAGLARASDSFVGELRAVARQAPRGALGNEVRLVGSLTLYRCESCGARFIEENQSGVLDPCTLGQWHRLIRGSA